MGVVAAYRIPPITDGKKSSCVSSAWYSEPVCNGDLWAWPWP